MMAAHRLTNPLFLKINGMATRTRPNPLHFWNTLAYHGNYVGPNWSAGKYQGSVAYSAVPPIDDFDRTAMEHDRVYALGGDLKAADEKFFAQNFGKGLKRTVAAVAVGTQGLFRSSSQKKMSTRGRKRALSISLPATPAKTIRARSVTSRSRSRSRSVVPSLRSVSFGKSASGSMRSKRSGGGSSKSKTKRRKTYKKSYKKRNKKYYKKYRRPVVSILETSGALSHPESIYVGHGLPRYHVLLNLVKELYRTLIGKAGQYIDNWNDQGPLMKQEAKVVLSYRDNFTGGTVPFVPQSEVYNESWTPAQKKARTHQKICEDWTTNLIASMPTTSNLQLDFIEAYFYVYYDAAASAVPLALLDLKHLCIDLKFTSSMIIQNITPNEDTTNQTDNITSNPLKITGYKNNRQVNGLYPKYVSDNSTFDQKSFMCDVYTGEIKTSPAVMGDTGTEDFQKPPKASVFDAAASNGSMTLAPGAFLKSYVTWKLKGSFHTFMTKYTSAFFKQAADNTNNFRLPMGNLKLYGMEHLLKSPGEEAAVSVKWQLVHKFATSSHMMPRTTAAYVKLYNAP